MDDLGEFDPGFDPTQPGFGGGGYYDQTTGQWVPRTGTTLNSPNPRFVSTPNSSSGAPAFADPSAPEFSPSFATQGGQLTTLTPNSSTGAPAPSIRTLPQANLPAPRGPPLNVNPAGFPIGGPLATGIGAIANMPSTPQEMNASANRIGGFADNLPGIHWLIQHGYLTPSTNPWDTQGAPATQTQPASASAPVTQIGVSTGGRAIPPAMGPPIPPGGVPPPPFRGPVPAYLPQGARTPSMQQGGGGYGGPGAGAAAPPAPALINLGHWQPTMGNARGNPTWVPGVYGTPANPSPQLFRGQTSAYGAPLSGVGPRGAQNYYTPGSAPMAPGDWTGTGSVTGRPVAPPVVAGNARGGGAQPPTSAPASQPLRMANWTTDAQGNVVGAPWSGYPGKVIIPAGWQPNLSNPPTPRAPVPPRGWVNPRNAAAPFGTFGPGP